MKMKLLLFLSCVLCVSAGSQYKDLSIHACSDSDAEDMVGLDGEVVWYADFINKKGVEPQPKFIDPISFPGAYESAVANREACRQNLNTIRNATKGIPMEEDPPSSVTIFTRDNVELDQKNTLLCYVSGFYPAPVHVFWTKNGQNVTTGNSSNVPYPNKDGSYRQMFRLDFTPQLGDFYSCTVEHLALDQPLTRIWDVEKTQPSVGPAVFCGVGLTLGLLGVAVGTFFLIKGNECS